MNRIICAAMLGSFLLLPLACGPSNNNDKGSTGDKPRLNGGGSTFVFPMMSKWAAVYEKDKGIQVNYQSIGSGGGIQKFTSKEFEFGCSDAYLNEEQMEKAKKSGGELVHIPLVLGAVVPVYNLSEIDDTLQLTGPLLADIFMRKITKWDDDRIKAINPKITGKLPAKNIVVVHRSDGSGTTHIFADYLAKVSPEWKKDVGVSTSLKWHDDTVGAKGNEGVAGQVKLQSGSIGYIEMTYALQNQLKFASVENQEKQFILASLESTTKAADNSLTNIPDDLRYSITNAPGKGAYPVCGSVWALLFVQQSGAKGDETVKFLRWVTREDGGQKYCKELHYAPLPKGLAERVDKMLAKVSVTK
jgi:phosphate transport system substrate-binding protein